MTAGTHDSRLTTADFMAFTIGAAFALLHLKRALGPDVSTPGLIVGSLAFLWLTATTAGPFVVLFRRMAGVESEGPTVGDRLWLVLGAPWILSSLFAWLQSGFPAIVLAVGVAEACLLAMIEVWRRWISVSAEEAKVAFSGAWTNRFGMILAIAWPVQIALLLIAST
ncbi:hypothetical protein [Paludisphaera rhizosphaerae]|uniref:hypothetical protein n=1 Tax=Paludisphaera rhizosphaerae TaxID=2711216 RepID=UPI0013EBB544|nr:hypothetical protein [Paludisphaera rhizosphaerae]